MKIQPYLTFGGSAVGGDADDENAPLIRIDFYNELAALTDNEKLKVLRAALTSLGWEPERDSEANRQEPTLAEIRTAFQEAMAHASRQNLLGYQNGDHYYRSIWGARLEALEEVYLKIFPETLGGLTEGISAPTASDLSEGEGPGFPDDPEPQEEKIWKPLPPGQPVKPPRVGPGEEPPLRAPSPRKQLDALKSKEAHGSPEAGEGGER